MSKLTPLTEKRRAHVESCKRNNDHSHETIANLYSNRSHCIYELLQNADDAHASKVCFSLTADELEFRHNGEKLFILEDVEAITTVGASPKKDDINSIGKFGIGFKSVFAVTEKPEIHSGEFHFRIDDFIVPTEIEPTPNADNSTTIILPFKSLKESKDGAHQIISDELRELKSQSLLFLRNIKKIEWKTESASGNYSCASKETKRNLISVINGKKSQATYTLFSKPLKINNKLNLSVAYRLNDDANNVIAENNAKLFVFFPTKEEFSLKFLIHAPYKTTPNRETIPLEDAQNVAITHELSLLIAESIRSIKNEGLLNVDFLSLLPLDAYNAESLYKVAFEKVKDLLTKEAIIPTADGGYATAECTQLARGKILTDLLEADDCALLFGRSRWIDPSITEDRTPELSKYLKEQLSIPERTMEDFCRVIEEDFIRSKSDKWLIDFYDAVTDNTALHRSDKHHPYQKGILRGKPVIRLEDGAHTCPENESGELQVYLPTSRKSEFKIVKQSIVSDKRALKFLEILGIDKPNDVTEVKEFIAKKYRESCAVSEQEYQLDFKKVYEIWVNNNAENKTKIVDILRGVNFIGCTDNEGKFCLRQQHKIYSNTEELRQWFESNREDDFYFVTDYLETEEFQEFTKQFALHTAPHALHTEQYHQIVPYYVKGLAGFNPKFSIEGLKFALEQITFERSVTIFNMALKYAGGLCGTIHESSRQNFVGGAYNVKKEVVSEACKLLKSNSWLYNQYGVLITKPLSEIILDDLHDKYNKSHENIDNLLDALGMKRNEIAQLEEKYGGKWIPSEEVDLYTKWKATQNKNAEAENNVWRPQEKASDVEIKHFQSTPANRKRPDLSGQTPRREHAESDAGELNSREHKTYSANDINRIGKWGEEYVCKHLSRESSDSTKVVWLNENGNAGKGYDFIVKEGDNEIYYEVKSTIGGAPKEFEITKTQWEWAKQQHDDGRGEMYRILLVYNAGTNDAKIIEISNPVEKWKNDELDAHPINIIL